MNYYKLLIYIKSEVYVNVDECLYHKKREKMASKFIFTE